MGSIVKNNKPVKLKRLSETYLKNIRFIRRLGNGGTLAKFYFGEIT